MRSTSFFVVIRGLLAMLMIALAILAAPTPGLAGTPDARSAVAMAADGDFARASHPAHEKTHGRSCHPDPSCAPAAILTTGPVFGAQGVRAARQPFAKTSVRRRNAPVDLPPPRA